MKAIIVIISVIALFLVALWPKKIAVIQPYTEYPPEKRNIKENPARETEISFSPMPRRGIENPFGKEEPFGEVANEVSQLRIQIAALTAQIADSFQQNRYQQEFSLLQKILQRLDRVEKNQKSLFLHLRRIHRDKVYPAIRKHSKREKMILQSQRQRRKLSKIAEVSERHSEITPSPPRQQKTKSVQIAATSAFGEWYQQLMLILKGMDKIEDVYPELTTAITIVQNYRCDVTKLQEILASREEVHRWIALQKKEAKTMGKIKKIETLQKFLSTEKLQIPCHQQLTQLRIAKKQALLSIRRKDQQQVVGQARKIRQQLKALDRLYQQHLESLMSAAINYSVWQSSADKN